MTFNDIKQLTKGVATITIQGHTEEVKLLTIKERELYEELVNNGLGTIQTNLGRNNDGKVNLNIQKVNKAQRNAEKYLIMNSFHEEITENDINQLYGVYDELVSELKRVNGIIESDNKELEKVINNNTEARLKK